MSFTLRISHLAERDIDEVLAWTRREFGEKQYRDYRDLIRLALEEVARDPEKTRRRPELHPDARTHHLARRGRRARHFLLLRINSHGVVEIARLLHDAMDLPAHLPPGYEA